MTQQADQITVTCSCGKRLKAPATAIGRKAKCPKCGNVLVVKAPPPPKPVEEEDDGLGAMYELAEKEAAASEQAHAEDTSPRCPKCGNAMAQGAVLCTRCGYDARSNKVLTTSKGAAKPAKASPLAAFGAGGAAKSSKVDYASSGTSNAAEGNYVLGLVFGGLFALGGGLVYGAIRYYMDGIPFIGWTVVLVGWLAGLGVQKGYKGGNMLAGVTAAGITGAVVLFVRVVVFAMIIAPAVKQGVKDAEDAADERDPRVAEVLAEEQYAKMGISPESANLEQLRTASKIAHERMKALSETEYKAYQKKAEAMELRDELAPYVQEAVLKEQKIDPEAANLDQMKVARREALKRIAAMSETEQKAKLKTYSAEEDKELEQKVADAKAKKGADSSSSSGSGKSGGLGLTGSQIGFFGILGILLLLWFFLPVLVAMSVAYKVAANA